MPPPRGTENPIEGPGDFEVTATVHNDTYGAIDSSKVNMSGRAVLIVGGSRGIGKATVLSFAKAGVSHLAVGARSDLSSLRSQVESAAKAAGKQPPKFLALKLDITSETSLAEAAKAVEKKFGRLDVLVNVAGILPEKGKVADSNADLWWQTWEVNLRGPYLSCRAFLPLLLKTTDGLKSICNVASVGALVVKPGLSAYQPSKTALVRVSEFIAKEYADEGLICFSIHPGNVATDILGPDGPGPLAFIFTETVNLPADTIVYLTNEQKTWLNGRYINVTWDMPQLEDRVPEIVDKDLLKLKFAFPS